MIYNLDVLEFLSQLETDSAHLAFLDPPYNIGVFCKMPEDEYLAWCEQWLVEVDRVLVDNGALWICHKNPDVLVDLSRMMNKLGRERKNWITWDKFNGNQTHKGYLDGYTLIGDLRSFQVMAEYMVYHVDEGNWTKQCDKSRGFIFEPLRAYLDGEKERAGFTTRQVAEAFQKKTGSRTVTGMAGHWFSNVQWTLPTLENYHWLRDLFNRDSQEFLTRSHESLRTEYESLRTEYKSLRYTFNNPGRLSSVWQIPPAINSPHPTPKPEQLLEIIIKATSNPGDTVLDPFCGSGTTAFVAQYLDRKYVVNDYDKKWCEYTRERLRVKRLL